MTKETPKIEFRQGRGWPIWFLLAVVGIIAFFVMNQGHNTEDAVSLNEIFRDDDGKPFQEDEPFIEEDLTRIEIVAPPRKKTVAAKPGPSDMAARQPIQTSPVQTASSTSLAAKKSSSLLTIQVASFKDPVKAKEFVVALQKAGFSGYITERDLKEKGLVYRVCVGEFTNQDAANGELAKLKKIPTYQGSFIITK